MPFKYPSLLERILANTVQSDTLSFNGTPCWIWTAKRNSQGYAVLTMRAKRGPNKGKVRCILAHRQVIREINGRVLNSRRVGCHLCNTKPCVNPEHLVGGTQRKNMRQCVAEGRHGNAYRAPVRALEAGVPF